MCRHRDTDIRTHIRTKYTSTEHPQTNREMCYTPKSALLLASSSTARGAV